MADAVISALVDQFVSRAFQKIEEEVRLVKNAKKDIEKLKKSLRLIQAFLEDAEKKQLESASVSEWLSNLEDISYDMDDVLDQWNTAILRSEIENESNCDAVDEKAKKVCLPLLNSCFSANQMAKEVISRREIAKKIQELTELLDNTKKDGEILRLVAIEPSQQQKSASGSGGSRITTSSVDETEVQGRQRDKAVLLGKLLSHKAGAIDVIPIVGMGGLGKTTLAQMVYNDDSLINHFDCRIWVCVSQPFELIKVAKAIVEGLHGNPQSYVEMEALSQFISEAIRGKKFLLVLDDFWSKDEVTWKQLYRPLSNGAPGSRILVTTRDRDVATMMGVNENMINSPETLSNEQCWSIIKQVTFVKDEDEGFAQLEVIGKRIAQKCKGLPLYAKILGGQMRLKKSERQWRGILNDQLWESKVVEDVYKTFLLSYYDLTPSEKCCFSYCSVFPEDYRIEKDILIEMWMSQGYLNDFTKGQDCFDSLAMRSFFQDFEVDEYEGSIRSCKMHDLVRDFAQFLVKERCLLLEGDDVGEKIEKLDNKARHLTLTVDSPGQLSQSRSNKKSIIGQNKVRTVLVASRRVGIKDCGVDFSNLTCVRTFTTLNSLSILQTISVCQHLRFLDLSHADELMELPDSVCELCNLQTLRLNWCTKLKRLPVGIEKLVNLRHLYNDRCYALEGFPKGFAKLTSLQKLDAIVIPKNKDAFFYVDDFTKLSALKLRGSLTIRHCTNFINTSDAEKLNLKNMEDLHTLFLGFDNEKEHKHEAMILEVLKPHSNLKDLWLWGYGGINLSRSWISSLVSLRTLRITNCERCEILPPLGILPSLESLALELMKRVKKVGVEFLGISETSSNRSNSAENRNAKTAFVSFPKLRKLTFVFLLEWKEWEGISDVNIKVMPSLHSLSIRSCNSLEALPDFLRSTPLQELSVEHGIGIRRWGAVGGGREWLRTCDISDIKFDSRYFRRNGVWIEEEERRYHTLLEHF